MESVRRRRPDAPARSPTASASPGVYFSFNGGSSWTQPTYTGWTARDCLGPPAVHARTSARSARCRGYVENGPRLRRRPGGRLRAAARRRRAASRGRNGSRLYYANLTSNFPAAPRVAPSRASRRSPSRGPTTSQAAAAGDNAAPGRTPVVISKQSSTTFSDKEQVWADNARVEPVLRQRLRLLGVLPRATAAATPSRPRSSSRRSTDGGDTWTDEAGRPGDRQRHQPARLTAAPSAPTATATSTSSASARVGARTFQLMYRSTDGGAHWTGPTLVAPVTVSPASSTRSSGGR